MFGSNLGWNTFSNQKKKVIRNPKRRRKRKGNKRCKEKKGKERPQDKRFLAEFPERHALTEISVPETTNSN